MAARVAKLSEKKKKASTLASGLGVEPEEIGSELGTHRRDVLSPVSPWWEQFWKRLSCRSSIQLTDLEGLLGPDELWNEGQMTQPQNLHWQEPALYKFIMSTALFSLMLLGGQTLMHLVFCYCCFNSQRKTFPLSAHLFKPKRSRRAMPPTYKLNNGI